MVKRIHLAPAGTQDVLAAADSAARAIPPAWPLATSVAVNPFLGQSGESLAWTAARLGRVAGVSVTMPRSWYRDRLRTGAITEADLAAALAAAPEKLRPADVSVLRAAVERTAPEPAALPTVADLAAEASGIDWPGVIAERIGAWAAGWFDAGQALWAAARGRGAYASWRAVATRDLTPEILGLTGFAAHVADAPETAHEALAAAADRLGLTGEASGTYFHRLFISLGGWAQLARQRLWEAELADGSDATLVELLAIRLLWEEALHARWHAQIADRWEAARHAHAEPVTPTADHILDAILQDAAERADQRRLAGLFDAPRATPVSRSMRPAAQAAFCIDVRSEVFRRALEAADPEIETIGFAGFFGLALSHRGFASDVDEDRCPVLLTPSLSTTAVCHDHDNHPHGEAGDRAARIAARARRAWGRFKLAAVSSFAFVEAMGPVHAGKLLRDALALEPKSAPADPPPRLDPALGLEARAAMAETVLRAMSLTGGFARVVLLVGHGAGVTNNPHASALHCGACGGHSGEVNARLLAALLNDGAVRAALAPRGIAIPADTLFVGALHDTTADRVTLYDADHPSPSHGGDVGRLRDRLAVAGALARSERASRLPRASGSEDVARRGRDWAEIRPEWALAGCTAFVAAPRARSARRDLGGRAFLHSYDWREDREFRVLELIMTAPVVVASWISLQYYGSTVAPTLFGAGNKLLHNVTGGVGVIEGNGGALRAGLPWQSVHDGERLVHEPLRLSVVIEAPRQAMNEVLRRHSGLRALFDNGWLHLFAMDEDGRLAWRYAGEARWEDQAELRAA